MAVAKDGQGQVPAINMIALEKRKRGSGVSMTQGTRSTGIKISPPVTVERGPL